MTHSKQDYSFLTFVTGNDGKAEEMRALLPGIKLVDADVPELQELDDKKIITAKLMAAFAHVKGPVLVDDTGLYLDCLGGQLPGPLVKWFLKAIKNTGLIDLAQRYGTSTATAKTILGYAPSPQELFFFEGSLHGELSQPEEHLKDGFGWDVVFKPSGYSVTLAGMEMAEKNTISMRARAVEKLKKHLLRHSS